VQPEPQCPPEPESEDILEDEPEDEATVGAFQLIPIKEIQSDWTNEEESSALLVVESAPSLNRIQEKNKKKTLLSVCAVVLVVALALMIILPNIGGNVKIEYYTDGIQSAKCHGNTINFSMASGYACGQNTAFLAANTGAAWEDAGKSIMMYGTIVNKSIVLPDELELGEYIIYFWSGGERHEIYFKIVRE